MKSLLNVPAIRDIYTFIYKKTAIAGNIHQVRPCFWEEKQSEFQIFVIFLYLQLSLGGAEMQPWYD